MIFSSGNCKKGLQVSIGKWKRPFEQVAWGDTNLAITTVDLTIQCMIPTTFPQHPRDTSIWEMYEILAYKLA
jgi:hypothetical protein